MLILLLRTDTLLLTDVFCEKFSRVPINFLTSHLHKSGGVSCRLIWRDAIVNHNYEIMGEHGRVQHHIHHDPCMQDMMHSCTPQSSKTTNNTQSVYEYFMSPYSYNTHIGCTDILDRSAFVILN